MELDDYKLKIFEKYIGDAGSNYESFLKEHDLERELVNVMTGFL